MISVCAPYWMRQDALNRMVEMYGRLYPGLDLELVIADDGSPEPATVGTDGVHPATVVRLPAKDYPLNPCVPINRAVEASRGEVIVLTNPEVVHDGPALADVLEALEGPDDYVTARCWGDGYGRERVWLAGPEVDYSTHGRLPVPPGAHFHFLAAFHRSLWDRAGGFDEDYRHVQACDDNDWLWRAHRAGARFKNVEATVGQTRSSTRWNMPHGRNLFYEKWPEAKGAVDP